ncbi:MAG: hypothetical protein D6731_07390 [Planctomycetota bacterium]|nr:MAG: hypothetical protein D6731_07390 [Planctomycetota bacterium]
MPPERVTTLLEAIEGEVARALHSVAAGDLEGALAAERASSEFVAALRREGAERLERPEHRALLGRIAQAHRRLQVLLASEREHVLAALRSLRDERRWLQNAAPRPRAARVDRAA